MYTTAGNDNDTPLSATGTSGSNSSCQRQRQRQQQQRQARSSHLPRKHQIRFVPQQPRVRGLLLSFSSLTSLPHAQLVFRFGHVPGMDVGMNVKDRRGEQKTYSSETQNQPTPPTHTRTTKKEGERGQKAGQKAGSSSHKREPKKRKKYTGAMNNGRKIDTDCTKGSEPTFSSVFSRTNARTKPETPLLHTANEVGLPPNIYNNKQQHNATLAHT